MIKYFKYNNKRIIDDKIFDRPSLDYPHALDRIYQYNADFYDGKKFGQFVYWDEPDKFFYEYSNWRILQAENIIEEINEIDFNKLMLAKKLKL